MNSKKVILDTGPLVAFLNKSDNFNKWVVTRFSQLSPPFFTCEAVISEACFLLRHADNGARNIFRIIERELIKIEFNLQSEAGKIIRMMKK